MTDAPESPELEPEPSAPSRSLLDALASEGEYVGDGGFTLDPERARAKLRDYALDEPEAYVLLLVEAAWLAGLGGIRSRIRFETGATTTAEFRSLEIDAASLANVIGAVFGSGEGLDGEQRARHRTLQKLGLAANAALALAPKRLLIEQQNPDGSLLRLVLAGEGAGEGVERERVEGPGEGRAGEAKTRFVFTGSALDLRRPAREREILSTRAAYANFPVECDRKRISAGLDAAFDRTAPRSSPPTAIATASPRKIIGAAVFDEQRVDQPGRLLLVTRGVLAETLERPDYHPGFCALVNVDLRKDLSQRRVIRDANFERVLAAVAVANEALKPAPEPEAELAASPAPSEDEEAGARTQQILAWAFAILGLFTIVTVLYTELIGATPPIEAGSVWRGRTECRGRRTTMILRVDVHDNRSGELELDGPAELESRARVRLLGKQLDDSAIRIDFKRWLDPPAAELEPLDLYGWRSGSLTLFVDGECESLRLGQDLF